MELKYGEALYFLDERDNKPWLDKRELEYKEKEEGEGFLKLKGGVFRKEYRDGWLQFDLKEWKLKIIRKKESFKLSEPLGYPEEEKEKAEIKYEEEYIIEGERYRLKERGGPIKGPIFEKNSSSNSTSSPSQSSEKDINDLKSKNDEQEKIINSLKSKNDEQEKAINDLKNKNEEQEKTLKTQGEQIAQLQEQLAKVMQFIQKGMLPT